VGIHHECIECSKAFDNVQAVQKHMIGKPHMAIRFEGEYDQFFAIEEISE